MRWILVFLFLYLVPIVIVFKNYKNLKRSCIYSGIYIVLVTTIVITNIYISGLNIIKDSMYYQNYVNSSNDDSKYVANFHEEIDVDEEVFTESKEELEISDNQNDEINLQVDDDKLDEVEIESNNKEIIHEEQNIKEKTDKDIIFDFKKQIYDIETIALIPMRSCLPYTKNISENIQNLLDIKEDLEYAQDKCVEVIDIYENMDIPELSSEEHTNVLSEARNDVKKAYELRKMAMESSIELVESKNPKHIGKITEYLKLSDNHISNFKDRLSDLNNEIE